MNTDLKLFQSFFPENILISDIENSENSIIIKLHSKTKSAICPYCKKESSGLHAAHHRKIHGLLVYGKQTWIDIILLEYNCNKLIVRLLHLLKHTMDFSIITAE